MSDIQQDIAAAVPLPELLRMVPEDSRVLVEREHWSASHPVGRMCHEAADFIDAQQKRIAKLERAVQYEQHREGRIGTHADNCYLWGPAHYECAIRKLTALERERDELRERLAAVEAECAALRSQVAV